MPHQPKEQYSLLDICDSKVEDPSETDKCDGNELIDYSFGMRLAEKAGAEAREIYEGILALVKERYP